MIPELIYSILFFIVAIGVLITFHEYGHFWMARRMGVEVLRFSVGFGPVLWRYTPENSLTEYAISVIPLGGYVRMLDESQDEVPEPLKASAFNRQPLYKRSAIVAAGPLANFLLAAILYAIVFMLGTEGLRPVVGQLEDGGLAARSGFQVGDVIQTVNGKSNASWDQNHFYVLGKVVGKETVLYEVENEGQRRDVSVDFGQLGNVDFQTTSIERMMGMFPMTPMIRPIVAGVVSGFPADAAGLEIGDEIIQINDAPVSNWNDLVNLVGKSTEPALLVRFVRDGIEREVMLQPRIVERDGSQVRQIGISVNAQEQLRNSDVTVRVRHGPIDSLMRGFETMWSTTVLTIKMLASMITMNQSADSIGGPIAIAEYAGKAAQAGVNNYLTFLALLSISLGILNLLPIPVLDGGHLMFHAYEAVAGSPPSEKMLIVANQIGLFLLICLMGFAFYNDLARIF